MALAPANRSLVMKRCLNRIGSWRVPPNWSALDWLEEARAISAAAACQAEIDFDSSQGVPIAAFIYQRVVATVFTRYRQEWAFARHCLPSRVPASTLGLSDGEDDEVPPCRECGAACPVPSLDQLLACEALGQALSRLSPMDRELLLRLFWYEHTESQIAGTLGISQPAVNKRKQAIFRQLHLWFKSHDEGIESHRLAGPLVSASAQADGRPGPAGQQSRSRANKRKPEETIFPGSESRAQSPASVFCLDGRKKCQDVVIKAAPACIQ
jgi:DNA-directed RNA polymerase specialized sigma24 family protein